MDKALSGKRNDIDCHWYVVQTKPRQECLAQQNLENQHYRTCLPMLERQRRKRGAWRASNEPLFPGYLFLHANIQTDNLSPVRSTLGVRNIVKFGGYPVPIPGDILGYLMDAEEARSQTDNPEIFQPGDNVEVLAGPFSGLSGVFEKSATDRVIVLLEILGRVQRLKFDVDDLMAV